jgi:fructose-1,6-bisphosphatase/inositol monophosphatase family enzyme
MSEFAISRDELLVGLREVHAKVFSVVMARCETSDFEELAGEPTAVAGDTAYAIDLIAERAMLEAIEFHIASRWPVVVIGEGVPSGQIVLPKGAEAADCQWRIIVDPIDGTRAFVFQKRSGWILTGAAPNRGRTTSIADIEVALQTELPLLKQHMCDSFWAIRGKGAQGTRLNRHTGEQIALQLRPSSADTLSHGYGTVCNFFAGGRDLLGRIADELSNCLLDGSEVGEARIFDDQNASTGGQIAGLAMGQDRFVADLRPLLLETLANRGQPLGHCCHPYDLCTKLIAEEMGVQISGPNGHEVDVPLDTETNVAWVGYANEELRNLIEPVLKSVVDEILD